MKFCLPYRESFLKDEKLFQIRLLFLPPVNLNQLQEETISWKAELYHHQTDLI